MQFESEQGGVIDSPSSAEIERVVKSLDADVNTFAILKREPLTYIQTRTEQGQFELEYQDGDTDRHYQSTRLVSRDEVAQAFTLYAKGDDAWRSLVEWQHLDLSDPPTTQGAPSSSQGGCAGVVLLAGALVLLGWMVAWQLPSVNVQQLGVSL